LIVSIGVDSNYGVQEANVLHQYVFTLWFVWLDQTITIGTSTGTCSYISMLSSCTTIFI